MEHSIYNSLSNDEKDLVENILGGFSHERYNQDEINKLIEKYNITKGEILIGNDNPDLLKQLKVSVLGLVKYNVLDLKQITPILQYLFLLM